jgi:hypothetical protein
MSVAAAEEMMASAEQQRVYRYMLVIQVGWVHSIGRRVSLAVRDWSWLSA